MAFLANLLQIMVKYYIKYTFFLNGIENNHTDIFIIGQQDAYPVDLPTRPNLANSPLFSEPISFVGHDFEPKHP